MHNYSWSYHVFFWSMLSKILFREKCTSIGFILRKYNNRFMHLLLHFFLWNPSVWRHRALRAQRLGWRRKLVLWAHFSRPHTHTNTQSRRNEFKRNTTDTQKRRAPLIPFFIHGNAETRRDVSRIIRRVSLKHFISGVFYTLIVTWIILASYFKWHIMCSARIWVIIIINIDATWEFI